MPPITRRLFVPGIGASALSSGVREAPAQRPDVFLYMDNKLYSAAALKQDPSAWPIALHEQEKPLAPLRLLSHYLAPIAEKKRAALEIIQPRYT